MASDALYDVYDKYQDFVKQNVDIIGEVETALKWLSYFVAGRGSKTSSAVLSELVYSASNVLSLVNDTIIRSLHNDQPSEIGVDCDRVAQGQFVRVTLTLIDYLEVFAEISSDKLWGTKGKWLIITVIQICKFALRLFLMLKHRCGILTSPPALPLSVQQRKDVVQSLKEKRQQPLPDHPKKVDNNAGEQSKIQMTFKLKRSGRIVRSLSSAPPVAGRTWKLPVVLTSRAVPTGECAIATELNQIQLLGEALHAVRPLVHLLVRLSLGQQSWSQWLLACGMDVASLRLLGNQRQFNAMEVGELRFRSIALLHYMLRSPFYDKFTRERLIQLLGGMSRSVPLARFICNPVVDFMPTWQNIYFYSWGS